MLKPDDLHAIKTRRQNATVRTSRCPALRKRPLRGCGVPRLRRCAADSFPLEARTHHAICGDSAFAGVDRGRKPSATVRGEMDNLRRLLAETRESLDRLTKIVPPAAPGES